MTAFPIGLVRADTPGCLARIHFNNAGASLAPKPVAKTVADHLRAEAELGGYEAADAAQHDLEQVYTAVAAMLHCTPAEIALTENASRAWQSAVLALDLEEGDHVLVHNAEYGSNYLALQLLAERRGVIIDVAGSDATGAIDLDDLEQRIHARTKLVALTHIPSHRGVVNPVAAVGDFARRHGLIYILDAAQSVGQTPIDVKAIGCHLLCGTGRKFLRAPRGTAFLYVDRVLSPQLLPPLVDLRGADWHARERRFAPRADARVFEGWEANLAGRLGLGAAVRYGQDLGFDAIHTRVVELATLMRTQISALPGVTVLERGPQKSAIVAFTSRGEVPEQLVSRLRLSGANVSVIWPSAAPLDDIGNPAVRVSPHYYNTEGEIDAFCRLLAGGAA